MYIGAIADDLTGATDLALMLSRGGMRVLQVVGVPSSDAAFGDAEAVVVSLKSRTIPAAEAVTQSLASADVLLKAGAKQIVFKYCSTFDSTDEGNIGPVIEALLDRLGETRTIACPAFPANKRTVYKGHLFVGDQLLSDSPMRDHPLTPMRDANLVRVLSRQMTRPVSLIDHDVVKQGVEALANGFADLYGVAIVDAITDDDLIIIGEALKDMKLITGGSGIALGLPGNVLAPERRNAAPACVEVPAGRAVILAGSCSAATRGQIAYAVTKGIPAFQLDAFAIIEGRISVDDAVRFASASTAELPPLIYSSAAPDDVAKVQSSLGRNEAGLLIEEFLGELARKLAGSGFNRFLVAGGETSGAVVGALGISALEIGPEIDPGVPWTRSVDTDQPMALALKSGNFGDETFFIKAWSLLQ